MLSRLTLEKSNMCVYGDVDSDMTFLLNIWQNVPVHSLFVRTNLGLLH